MASLGEKGRKRQKPKKKGKKGRRSQKPKKKSSKAEVHCVVEGDSSGQSTSKGVKACYTNRKDAERHADRIAAKQMKKRKGSSWIDTAPHK